MPWTGKHRGDMKGGKGDTLTESSPQTGFGSSGYVTRIMAGIRADRGTKKWEKSFG